MGIVVGPVWSAAPFQKPQLHAIVKWLLKHLRHLPPIDVVAASGHSGAVVATALSYQHPTMQLALVRPWYESEVASRRHNDTVNTFLPKSAAHRSWIFVDDLIDSGRTLFHVTDALTRARVVECERPEAIFLYNTREGYYRNDKLGTTHGGVIGNALHDRFRRFADVRVYSSAFPIR